MPITGRHDKQLDEKECFELWLKLGSLQKVSNRLASEGKINVNTGEPFTYGGVRFAALRYVIYNPDEAKEAMREADPYSPYVQTEGAWYRFLVHRARDVFASYGKEKIHKWAEDYEVPERYIEEEIYG